MEILGACQEQDMKGLENSKEVSKVVFGSSLRIDLMHRIRLRFEFLKGLPCKLLGCHIDTKQKSYKCDSQLITWSLSE